MLDHNNPLQWHRMTPLAGGRYKPGFRVEDTGDFFAVVIKANATGVTDIHVGLFAEEDTADMICALLNADLQRL